MAGWSRHDHKDAMPHHEIAPECPAETHNIVRTANRVARRCICPHAQSLRAAYLAKRRRTEPPKGPGRRVEAPLRDPLPPVRGDSAAILLAPYSPPPHLCVGEDPELWFSPSPYDRVIARDICSRCPMRKHCEQAAIDNGFQGVWGESDEEERRHARGSWTRVG